MGLGSKGVILYVREDMQLRYYPAVYTRDVVNTAGAGDSLFAAFIHFYSNGLSPYNAMEKAMVFASYKIGARGASEGFLSAIELDREIGHAVPLD